MLWLGKRSKLGNGHMHLTEDEALLVETVTKLVSDEVKPFARGWETTGIPKELWTTLGELGLPRSQPPSQAGVPGCVTRSVVGYSPEETQGCVGAEARHALRLGRCPFYRALPCRATTKDWSWNIDHQRPRLRYHHLEDEQVSGHCSRVPSPQRFIGGRSLGHAELDREKSDEALGSYQDTEGLESQGALLAACMAWGFGRSALDAATTYALDREYPTSNRQISGNTVETCRRRSLLEAAELLIDDGLSHPTTHARRWRLKPASMRLRN